MKVKEYGMKCAKCMQKRRLRVERRRFFILLFAEDELQYGIYSVVHNVGIHLLTIHAVLHLFFLVRQVIIICISIVGRIFIQTILPFVMVGMQPSHIEIALLLKPFMNRALCKNNVILFTTVRNINDLWFISL